MQAHYLPTWKEYRNSKPLFHELRSSNGFITTIVAFAVFTVCKRHPPSLWQPHVELIANEERVTQDVFIYGVVRFRWPCCIDFHRVLIRHWH